MSRFNFKRNLGFGFCKAIALVSMLNILTLISSAFANTELLQATDFDGDGVGDLSVYDPATGKFAVRTSSTLTTSSFFSSGSKAGDVAASGDYNGDGVADAATYNRSTATYHIKITGGSDASAAFGAVGGIPVPGDYWGRDCTNLATFNPATAEWYMGDHCDGSGFTAGPFVHGAKGGVPMSADFDCDGLDDAMVFDPGTTTWSLRKSSNLTVDEFFFGLAGDIPIVMYENNGCAKAGIYRPTGGFFVKAESYTPGNTAVGGAPVYWGLVGDRPGLFNVDNTPASDFTVFRPSNLSFFTKNSSGAEFFIPFNSSTNTLVNVSVPTLPTVVQTKRIPGDYNRDGLSDYVVASVNRSNGTTKFDILYSNGSSSSALIGSPGDAITPGDFDGDGKTQPAIVNVNTSSALLEWHYLNAAGTEQIQAFGQNGDQPVVGDVDCDGKDDMIVARNVGENKVWYILKSSGGIHNGLEFGQSGDNVYVADPNGDGCDEFIVSRVVNGGVRFRYRGLTHTSGVTVVNWGLAGDKILTPMDMDGDGKDNFIVVRPLSGLNWAFVHQPVGSGFIIAFGLQTDQPFAGYFGGAQYAEMGAYRTANKGASSFFVRRFDANVILNKFGDKTSILVRPDGTVVQPGSGGGDDNGGGSGGVGCNGTQKSWSGGALWKPVSESVPNHAPAILLPTSPHCSLHRSGKLKVTILGKDGTSVTGFQKNHCNGANGSRSHWWTSRTASDLKKYAPLTVKTEYQGKTECRTVPDPTKRYE